MTTISGFSGLGAGATTPCGDNGLCEGTGGDCAEDAPYGEGACGPAPVGRSGVPPIGADCIGVDGVVGAVGTDGKTPCCKEGFCAGCGGHCAGGATYLDGPAGRGPVRERRFR